MTTTSVRVRRLNYTIDLDADESRNGMRNFGILHVFTSSLQDFFDENLKTKKQKRLFPRSVLSPGTWKRRASNLYGLLPAVDLIEVFRLRRQWTKRVRSE